LLAYASVDGREVNAALVELGYACTLHVPPNGDARAAEFENLELRAASEQRGLWSHCEARACR
jgi:micrococcal nuclease